MAVTGSVGETDVQRVMDRIASLLPPCPPGPPEAERLRHFEHATSFLLRYGAKRGDPIQRIMAHVGNYWGSAILVSLQSSSMRPSTLQKLLGTLSSHQPISQRMLTLNLRTLEEDGLIEREVLDVKNAHVEYRLTPMGRELSHLVVSLIDWAGSHFHDIVEARERYVPPLAPTPK